MFSKRKSTGARHHVTRKGRDTEKASARVQHPPRTKRTRDSLGTTQGVLPKPSCPTERLRVSLRSGRRQGHWLSPVSQQCCTQVLARAIRSEKEIKGIQVEREKGKLFLFTNHKILPVENAKKSTRTPAPQKTYQR